MNTAFCVPLYGLHYAKAFVLVETNHCILQLFQMDIDEIFREIGELGRQQCIYGACFCLMNGYAAFHMLQVFALSMSSLSSFVCFCVLFSILL